VHYIVSAALFISDLSIWIGKPVWLAPLLWSIWLLKRPT